MNNADHEQERASEREVVKRDQALRRPQHFYPRPEDVLADATLHHDEKIELLRNWQVHSEDRGGARADAPDAASTRGDDDVEAAIDRALRQLQAGQG